jgi:hypothetical protein
MIRMSVPMRTMPAGAREITSASVDSEVRLFSTMARKSRLVRIMLTVRSSAPQPVSAVRKRSSGCLVSAR